MIVASPEVGGYAIAILSAGLAFATSASGYTFQAATQKPGSRRLSRYNTASMEVVDNAEAILPDRVPLPPPELRRLVCHDDSFFDLPDDGLPIFPSLTDSKIYRSVFDFGCGCGRLARRLLVQRPRPSRYVGIDINRPMVEWCRTNLTPVDPAFEFQHHDVWNLGLGPENTRQDTAPLPVMDQSVSLFIAHSVFTHLYKNQTEFYLSEIARVLTDDGVARTTWFLFDRQSFPMLFDFQVCLFINETDPTNAVIYDWQWLLTSLSDRGLRITHTVPATVKGHQWELFLTKSLDKTHSFPSDCIDRLTMCGTTTASTAPSEAVAPTAGAELIPPQSPDTEASTGPKPLAASRHLFTFPSVVNPEAQRRAQQLPWWYHSYYFDNGFAIRGDYDIGADIAGYGFPDNMEGLKVLDVGTGAGWFSFYFEQRGAQVTTLDARGYCDFDVYGRFQNPPLEKDRLPDRLAEDGSPIYFSPVSEGFWRMKDFLQSKVRFVNGTAYDPGPSLFGNERFDLVFLGAILCHLRDPIGALMAARSVCRHRVIASTPVVIGEPESDTLPRQYLPYTKDDNISWWLPNEACFKHWFLAAGFTGVDVTRQVTLRADVVRTDQGKWANGDQILRVGSAFVP